MPVIFPLAGWDPVRTGLREWLADRLAADYRPLAAPVDGRRTLARALLDAGLVLPVLDGFDELARLSYGEAVRRVNEGLDDDLPLLLTSRSEAWAAAVAEGDVLTAAEVVELLPLDLDRAGAHLERTARPLHPGDGAPVTVWTPVLRRLSARHPVAMALTTPLMVSLARAVYGDTSRDPAELLDTERFPTPGAVEEHLLGAFVPAAYAPAGARAGTEAVCWRGRSRTGTPGGWRGGSWTCCCRGPFGCTRRACCRWPCCRPCCCRSPSRGRRAIWRGWRTSCRWSPR